MYILLYFNIFCRSNKIVLNRMQIYIQYSMYRYNLSETLWIFKLLYVLWSHKIRLNWTVLLYDKVRSAGVEYTLNINHIFRFIITEKFTIIFLNYNYSMSNNNEYWSESFVLRIQSCYIPFRRGYNNTWSRIQKTRQ